MKAILALEDGTWFAGHSFTGPGQAHGQVISQTTMSGYQQVVTDPAYKGQLVCLTSSLVGNYGLTQEALRLDTIHLPALIVKECALKPSHWQAQESLPDFLTRHKVLGVQGVDTRALANHLRIHGPLRAVLSTKEHSIADLVVQAQSLPPLEGLALVSQVSTSQAYFWTEKGAVPVADDELHWPKNDQSLRILVYDYGLYGPVLDPLVAQGHTLLVVPALFPVEQVARLAPQGILLSHGPGDPGVIPQVVDLIQSLSAIYPVLGWGLGAQVLGLALGANVFKLKQGHYGANIPVRDLAAGQISITTQNQDFSLDISTMDGQATHVHVHDQSLAGFRHNTLPLWGINFWPDFNTDQGVAGQFMTALSAQTRA